MSRTWPIVVALKNACSPGTRQGMPPSAPMTPLRATAATSVTVIGGSYRDGRLDARVRVVALDRDVLEVERVELGDRRVQPQGRQRPRLAGQLEPRLLEVVGVEVGVAEGVHE